MTAALSCLDATAEGSDQVAMWDGSEEGGGGMATERRTPRLRRQGSGEAGEIYPNVVTLPDAILLGLLAKIKCSICSY